MRNLCLGNALTKILAYVGNDVITATYPGDVGTHVAKCLWYIKNYVSKEEYPSSGQGDWLGKVYTRAVSQYSEKDNAGEVTEILKQIYAKKGEVLSTVERNPAVVY